MKYGSRRFVKTYPILSSSWLLGDHLGSTSMVADATGSMVSEVRYSAFGESRYEFGTMTTDYLYTGQRQEAEIGLYYYVARWYDPAIGRFIQADSVVPDPGSALGYDRFAYVSNNPLKYIDPTGHVFGDPPGSVPCIDGICDSSQQSSGSSAASNNSSSMPNIPGLPQIDGGINSTITSSPTPPLSVRDAFGNRPDLQIYKPWEVDILFELFRNGGQEGFDSVNYIIANQVHIKVGKPFLDSNGDILLDGDWQSATWVGAWYEGNSVYLNPNSGYSETKLPDKWGLSLVAHEAKHIEQGGFPGALTKKSEMVAWQLGLKVYENLGGVLSSNRDINVAKAKTVQEFTSAIQKYDPVYWQGLQLLPNVIP